MSDFFRSIAAASPLASVLNSGGSLVSADFVEPALEPHACGVALSFPIGDAPSMTPGTLIVWTVSSTVPRWMLPLSPHFDVLLGHLYVSLRCSALEPIVQGRYLARRVTIESNLPQVRPPDLERIIQWLSQCDDPVRQASAGVFRAWQRSHGYYREH